MKSAKIEVQILVFLIIIVLTSASVLSLIYFGIISPKESSGEGVLNTEFVPLGREGYLAVKDFKFCEYVDEKYRCKAKEVFSKGDKVNFAFALESTVQNGVVMIVENYRVKSPSGKVLLEAEDKDNFNYEMNSSKPIESVVFKDYFVLVEDEKGEYSLELVLENPLIGKKVE